jgi:hypothetical protein
VLGHQPRDRHLPDLCPPGAAGSAPSSPAPHREHCAGRSAVLRSPRRGWPLRPAGGGPGGGDGTGRDGDGGGGTGRDGDGGGGTGAGSASRLAGWCGWQLRCSNACSRDSVDMRRDPGRGETPRGGEQRTRWTTWTRRVSVDGDRFSHNPEVEGSNPSPATSFRRSSPFSYQGEGLLRAGRCSKTCSSNSVAWRLVARRGETGRHGMRQPGRGGR